MASTGPGRTGSVPVTVPPLNVAVILTVVAPATAPAIPVNVADVAPNGITIDAGTAATAGVSLLSAMVDPPNRAGPLRLTVPVNPCPLDTNGIVTPVSS